MEQTINVAAIVHDSVVDGPGIRTTIFLQGCKHHCPGCHNPQLQGDGGYFTTPKELAQELTDGGNELKLTLSGGEPMLQADALFELLYEITMIMKRKPDVWCYTGFTWEEIQQNHSMMRLVSLCDVIIDGRFEIDKRDTSLLFKGSSNQRLINVKETYEKGEIVLWEN